MGCKMNFPILICAKNTLFVAGNDFLKGIGKMDETLSRMEVNVTNSGTSELNWILDCEGILYDLIDDGLAEISLFQKFKLTRRKQKLIIKRFQAVTAQELIERIANLKDPEPDLPNVTDLRQILQELPPNKKLDRNDLRAYFGE